MEYGRIRSIDELHGFKVGNRYALNGSGGARLGLSQMVDAVFGSGGSMDGYAVVTSKHTVRTLIDDGQSCCEDSGYFSTDDDLSAYVGANLRDIEITDTALNTKAIDEKFEYGFDGGGVMFVTFKTSRGDFQLAVYNSHNGYYGHGIIVAVDDEIKHQDTL